MRWIVSLSIVFLPIWVACGGPQIPTHNGYKPKEAKPWKKPKALKLDDKLEAKADGEVSYADMRRARWFQVELPSSGQLALGLEITPPGDAVNDDFDLGMEVFDPSFHVVSKSDLEDEDAHELNKKKNLVDLAPGKYLIHVFLQGRMDTADFVLHATFKPTSGGEGRTNFPADVLFVPALAMVPLQDDTPRNYKPVQTTTVKVIRKPHNTVKEPAKPAPPPAVTINAAILGVQVVSGGTLITLGRGTATGAQDGMKVTITGVSGKFEIGHCTDRICTATIPATPDQIKRANGSATLTP